MAEIVAVPCLQVPGTEERQETDGRTRKVRVVTVGHCVRVLFPQSDPNLDGLGQSSQKFETSRFDKRRLYTVLEAGTSSRGLQGPTGPGLNASQSDPFKLLTPLSAPIHFCPNKTPVNLGDDSSFVIRIASPNLKASWKTPQALSSAFFISASELTYLSPFGELYFPELATYTSYSSEPRVRSHAGAVASAPKPISQVTGTPLLGDSRSKRTPPNFLMSATNATPGRVSYPANLPSRPTAAEKH
ncbi:hypothetical protein EDB87DRAFT_1576357 [Lactarius vividus]|nr:hypothetical protein EDB87DRAFT_1576357 [Lactarius vividus]